MATTSLSLIRLFGLTIVVSLFHSSAAIPWIVTQDYEERLLTNSAYTDYGAEYTYPGETITDIIPVTAPTGAPISTATITATDEDSYDVYTVVEVLYPYQTAVPTSTIDYSGDTTTQLSEVYTIYVVNLTFTAPASCSSTWPAAYATAVTVDPPYDLPDALKPTSVSTTYSTDNSRPFKPTTITEAYAYLDPTQLPASSLSLLSYSYAPYPSCYYPGPSNPSSTGSSSSSEGSVPCYDCYYDGNDNNESWINDSSDYGISPLAIILISVLGWTFVIFVAGLFENYFYFQRLMKGWQARRGLPRTWWFYCFPITCVICLGFSRKGFQARSEADANELTEKWKETGFWMKKRLWLQHGFGCHYPSMLGPAPPRVGRPSKSAPTRPLLQVSPPPSEAGLASRQATPRTSDVDIENTAATAAPAQPEMSGGVSPQQLLQVPARGPRPQATNKPTPSIPEEDEITEAPALPFRHTGDASAEIAPEIVTEKIETETEQPETKEPETEKPSS